MKNIRLYVSGGVLFLLFCGGVSAPRLAVAGGEPELKDLGNGICEQKNGLMWQVERSKKISAGAEAQLLAESLELGGYSDWRLPTQEELYDLCDIFELKLEGDCPIKLKGSYWSKDSKLQAGEWEAYPLCGGSEYKYLKKKRGWVRAVRP